MPAKIGRGTKRKPLLVLVERNGRARAMPIQGVNSKTPNGAIRENVDCNSMILTDKWATYRGIAEAFRRGHFSVNYGAGEYAQGRPHQHGGIVLRASEAGRVRVIP